MEDEENALKKQLEACKDYEERRGIRKKLRILRQKEIDALETEPAGRRSRTREQKTEETITTVTDGVSKTVKHTTKTEVIENGDVKTEEHVTVIDKEPELESAPEPAPEPEPTAEPEPVEEAEPEDEQPEENVGETEDVPFYAQKSPESLTEQDIGEIDDLNFLETTLNDMPMKFFEVRKHLRTRIRKVKVSQAKQRADDKAKEKAKPSPKESQRVQTPQINIQDKSQLSLLRQQIEEQKREKEQGGTGSSATEVHETTSEDGGTKTKTTKTTEVQDGATGTTIVTKTTTTHESKSGGTGRTGAKSIEASLAAKKKGRASAKQAAFRNVKDKRNAFKEQLEASNPKPAGGVKKSFQAPNTAVNALLEWCRRKTRGYDVNIQNYTTSWADGMAMCALFHNFSPDLIPWETLEPKDRKRNWTLAFDAAIAEGLDPLVELDDILRVKVPEPKSLITYIHSIYAHFHEKTEKAKLEREQRS